MKRRNGTDDLRRELLAVVEGLGCCLLLLGVSEPCLGLARGRWVGGQTAEPVESEGDSGRAGMG
ncbi:MAG: hypothetical protein ACYDHH_08670 [Solirubrobacteraceae bacterium]